jgi:hypothetical protein
MGRHEYRAHAELVPFCDRHGNTEALREQSQKLVLGGKGRLFRLTAANGCFIGS